MRTTYGNDFGSRDLPDTPAACWALVASAQVRGIDIAVATITSCTATVVSMWITKPVLYFWLLEVACMVTSAMKHPWRWTFWMLTLQDSRRGARKLSASSTGLGQEHGSFDSEVGRPIPPPLSTPPPPPAPLQWLLGLSRWQSHVLLVLGCYRIGHLVGWKRASKRYAQSWENVGYVFLFFCLSALFCV